MTIKEISISTKKLIPLIDQTEYFSLPFKTFNKQTHQEKP